MQIWFNLQKSQLLNPARGVDFCLGIADVSSQSRRPLLPEVNHIAVLRLGTSSLGFALGALRSVPPSAR